MRIKCAFNVHSVPGADAPVVCVCVCMCVCVCVCASTYNMFFNASVCV